MYHSYRLDQSISILRLYDSFVINIQSNSVYKACFMATTDFFQILCNQTAMY